MRNKGELSFNELCLLVRKLARAIELLADTDDNTAEQNAAKAIALDAQDQINAYFTSIQITQIYQEDTPN